METKFGLPAQVKFCTKCVISNQRPCSAVEFRHQPESKKTTIQFDKEGVCDACRFAEIKKNDIHWEEREKALRDLCDRFRSKDGSYDCLVPGSGGKDSFYAAHRLKYEFGMHPLTVTWAPHLYTDWGWKNFQSWIHAGFDNYLCTPNGRVHRLLTRLALENLFHPFQPFMLGQKSLAPRLALHHKIRLIFFGENEAEYGNPLSNNSSPQRSKNYFSSTDKDPVFLSGVEISELISKHLISQNDLTPYLPVNAEVFQEEKLEVHYLGYYLKWHPQNCFFYAVEKGGFIPAPERSPGTYSKYNSIDDKMDDLHYFTTFIKFGIGRATYDAAQEIRSGDITREEGVALVKRYDGEFPERFAPELFQYLSIADKNYPAMNREYFLSLADRFRSPHLWKHQDGEWKLRHTVYDSLEKDLVEE